METDFILFLTITLSLIIGITGFVFLKQSHKKQKAAYPKLWEEFQNLKGDSVINTKELIKIGNSLIYNKFAPKNNLEIIHEFTKSMEFRYLELKELRLNAYNKLINHTHGYPSGNGVSL